MTSSSEPRLPTPTLASTYAALVASLPELPNGMTSPQGGWLVTVEGEPAETFEAVFGNDGQYFETGPQGDLDCPGFGNWQSTGPDTFEVSSQKPCFEGTACVGWVQTKIAGVLDKGAYRGTGQRTIFNLSGEEQSEITVTVRAERTNPTFVAESRA